VKAEMDGGWLWTCILDPTKGHNPLRVEVSRNGEMQWRAESELANYDGTWFPKRVELYLNDFEAGRVPTYIFDVTSAQFDKPSQPTSYTPADIGIVAGTSLNFYENNNALLDGRRRPMGWDGKQLLSRTEFAKRLKDGSVTRDPSAQRAINASIAKGKPLDLFLANWRRYTDLVISKYKLDPEQTEKAKAILEDCISQARSYCHGHEEQFQRIRADISRALGEGGIDAAGRSQSIAQLAQAMTRLERPLEEIYVAQLRPRLGRLPTRRQIAAAAESEAK
jgi:hypothetical protein